MRHHRFHELACLLEDLRVIDEDFADVAAQVVAQRTDDDVGFLVDQGRGLDLVRCLLDGFPDGDEVVEVPLQFLYAPTHAGGAHDDAHALGDVHVGECLANGVAVFAFDAARDATGTRVVRHQYEESAGEADEGRQCRALVAALFLVDLDQDFLAFLQYVLDIDLAAGITREIRAGDFLQWQEAVALGAVIHEGCFERRLDAGNPPLVDIGFLLFLGGGFDVEVVKALAVDHGNAQLFRLSCVDHHSLHFLILQTLHHGLLRITRADIAWLVPVCAMREPFEGARGGNPAFRFSALRDHAAAWERIVGCSSGNLGSSGAAVPTKNRA